MEKLIQSLTRCEKLLRLGGSLFWADKIKNLLQKSDGSIGTFLAEEIVSWFGGMGSLNDVMISEYNNHLVQGEDEKKFNDELDELRNTIYQEAKRLK